MKGKLIIDSDIFVNKFHKFFLNIGLFFNIFPCMAWEKFYH